MPDLCKSISRENYGFGIRAMDKVKVCPNCGTAAKASERFCGECGTKLPEDTLFQTYKKQSRYCVICDTVVPPAARFCPKCGTRLKRWEENHHGIL